MSDIHLFEKIQQLQSVDSKIKLNQFVEELLMNEKTQNISMGNGACNFGIAKGLITIHPNFDDPIPEFDE